MSASGTKEAAQFGKRVYEYTSDSGAVFWSFTKLPNMVSPPQRLYLKARVGTHLINFLAKLRQRGDVLSRDTEGGDEGRVEG